MHLSTLYGLAVLAVLRAASNVLAEPQALDKDTEPDARAEVVPGYHSRHPKAHHTRPKIPAYHQLTPRTPGGFFWPKPVLLTKTQTSFTTVTLPPTTLTSTAVETTFSTSTVTKTKTPSTTVTTPVVTTTSTVVSTSVFTVTQEPSISTFTSVYTVTLTETETEPESSTVVETTVTVTPTTTSTTTESSTSILTTTEWPDVTSTTITITPTTTSTSTQSSTSISTTTEWPGVPETTITLTPTVTSTSTTRSTSTVTETKTTETKSGVPAELNLLFPEALDPLDCAIFLAAAQRSQPWAGSLIRALKGSHKYTSCDIALFIERKVQEIRGKHT
ncbi:hypothetical protein VM1G_10841 [Cytospora mali]|uniref:Zonadhesin n=1 Tax=Cytospora mali TaxID=578113 RepID=A0A194VJC3_CYTMA|nr:hypothetical protein VM1G_10841 [Valsa mali]